MRIFAAFAGSIVGFVAFSIWSTFLFPDREAQLGDRILFDLLGLPVGWVVGWLIARLRRRVP